MNAVQRTLAAALLLVVTPIAVAQRGKDQAPPKPETPEQTAEKPPHAAGVVRIRAASFQHRLPMNTPALLPFHS